MNLFLFLALVVFLLWLSDEQMQGFLSLIGGGTVLYWGYVSILEFIA